MEILFTNEKEISDQWLDYVEMEAGSLSESTELEIENYMDRELINPQVQQFLFSDEGMKLIADVQNEISEPLALNAVVLSNPYASNGLINFKKLKRKIRRIFCQVTKDLGDLEWKDIIKAILVALIPAFASGVPAIVLPIVVALVALLMKRGYDAVCPAA